MPFPLLGPTTLLHLIVIILGAIWRFFFPRRESDRLWLSKTQHRIVCSAIIVLVTTGVVSSATSVLYVTAKQTNSTINVVAAYLEEDKPMMKIEVTVPDKSRSVRLLDTTACQADYNTESLVEYLRFYEFDDSVKARRNLAFDFGITGYQVLSEQDVRLLALIKQAHCQNDDD